MVMVMDLVHPRCAGIDVPKRDAKVCVRVAGRGRAGAASKVRTWGSFTSQVLALRGHLISEQVSLVVMDGGIAGRGRVAPGAAPDVLRGGRGLPGGLPVERLPFRCGKPERSGAPGGGGAVLVPVAAQPGPGQPVRQPPSPIPPRCPIRAGVPRERDGVPGDLARVDLAKPEPHRDAGLPSGRRSGSISCGSPNPATKCGSVCSFAFLGPYKYRSSPLAFVPAQGAPRNSAQHAGQFRYAWVCGHRLGSLPVHPADPAGPAGCSPG
jgi:hypothetical protein